MDVRKSDRRRTPKKFEGYLTFSLQGEESEEDLEVDLRSRRKKLKTKNKKRGIWKFIEQEENESYRVSKKSKKIKKKKKHLHKTTKKIKNHSCRSLQPMNSLGFLLEWKRTIKVKDVLMDPEGARTFDMLPLKNLATQDLTKYARDLQAILINLPAANSTKATLSNLKKLNFDKRVIRNGIIFIWSDTTILSNILDIMEEKGFIYIENFSIIELSRERLLNSLTERQLEELKNLRTYFIDELNPSVVLKKKFHIANEEEDFGCENEETNDGAIEEEENSNGAKHKNHPEEDILVSEDVLLDYLIKRHNINAQEYFIKRKRNHGIFMNTKKTLLMFRRFDKRNSALELRHQRTPDVLFTLSGEYDTGIDLKTKEFVYNMIETLLPRAHYNEQAVMNIKNVFPFRMMELWGNPERPRKGWVTLCEINNHLQNYEEKAAINLDKIEIIDDDVIEIKVPKKRGRKKKSETVHE